MGIPDFEFVKRTPEHVVEAATGYPAKSNDRLEGLK